MARLLTSLAPIVDRTRRIKNDLAGLAATLRTALRSADSLGGALGQLFIDMEREISAASLSSQYQHSGEDDNKDPATDDGVACFGGKGAARGRASGRPQPRAKKVSAATGKGGPKGTNGTNGTNGQDTRQEDNTEAPPTEANT